MKKVNLSEKLAFIKETWSPKVVGLVRSMAASASLPFYLYGLVSP